MLVETNMFQKSLIQDSQATVRLKQGISEKKRRTKAQNNPQKQFVARIGSS